MAAVKWRPGQLCEPECQQGTAAVSELRPSPHEAARQNGANAICSPCKPFVAARVLWCSSSRCETARLWI